MRCHNILAGIFGLILVGLNADRSLATSIIDSSSGLSSPDVIVDFGVQLFPTSTLITDQFSSQGINFGSPAYRYGNCQGTDGSDGQCIGGMLFEGSLDPIQPGSIHFTNDLTAAVLQFAGGNNITTFDAYLDDILVESFTTFARSDFTPIGYYGFYGTLFNEIRLTMSHVDFIIDKIEYSIHTPTTVSLPDTFPLLATSIGIMALLAAWRRTRKAG